MRQRHSVESAAGNVMRELDHLTPDEIVDAAPEGHEEEAFEAARKLEDMYMDIDQVMYEIQEAVTDD